MFSAYQIRNHAIQIEAFILNVIQCHFIITLLTIALQIDILEFVALFIIFLQELIPDHHLIALNHDILHFFGYIVPFPLFLDCFAPVSDRIEAVSA